MSITFGPVNSRRFGKSLGVDLSPDQKQCNFDCLYCELKPAKTLSHYSSVTPVEDIIDAIKESLRAHKDIDFLTITANGEPTLYPHLSELMDRINTFKGDTQTLILSNGSTIADNQVQKALLKFDNVKLSLDCATSSCFKKLDRADKSVHLESIKSGMLEFKKAYSKNLFIEILFVSGINDTKEEVSALNSFLKLLKPSRIDLSTIDRPPAYNIKPLSYDRLYELSLGFDANLPIAIATKQPNAQSKFHYSKQQILDTLAMRPLTKEDIEVLFDDASKHILQQLLSEQKLENFTLGDINFIRTIQR